MLAPFEHVDSTHRGYRLRLRRPLTGLLQGRIEHPSLLLFVLFTLASTAFDGLHDTVIWRRLFRVDLYHAVLAPWLGGNPFTAFSQLLDIYRMWQSLWLLLAPVVYLAVYLFLVWLAGLAAGGRPTMRALADRFAPALLPIALVYNLSHHYTLIQVQG